MIKSFKKTSQLTCLCLLLSSAQSVWADFIDIIVLVTINGQETNHQTIALTEEKEIYLAEADWHSLRLRKPTTPPIYHNNQVYYSIEQAGLTYQYTESSGVLNVIAKAQDFLETSLALPVDWITPQQAKFGTYFNYDVLVDRLENETSARGLFELNVFQPKGILNVGFIGSTDKTDHRLTRLDTSWRFDQPKKMRTFVFGDSSALPGDWGRSFLFGGIQIRKNFSTQPNFAPYPNGKVTGEVTLPSTVELFINNIKFFQEQMEPGEFNIQYQPPNIGNGTVQVVTTDILGRQQMLDLPFYSSPELLKPGLHDYSLEIGKIRKDYGAKNISYGDNFIVLMDNIGLTEQVTSSWRIEASSQNKTFGGGLHYRLQNYATLTGQLVASRANSRVGHFFVVGADRQQKHVNYGVRGSYSSESYKQLGQSEESAKYLLQANVGFIFKSLGSINTSYVKQTKRQGTNSQVLNLNYNRAFWKKWYFSSFLVHDIENNGNTTVFFTLSRAFGNDKNISINHGYPGSGYQTNANFSKSVIDGTGLAYQANAATSNDSRDRLQGRVSYYHNSGIYGVELEHNNDQNAARISANGSLIYMQNRFAVSQPIRGSFALVDVPGESGLEVFYNNRITSHTNKTGLAVIPNLSPYTNNKIFIAGEQLPLNTQISTLKQTIIPYAGVGVYVPFQVSYSRSVILQLLQLNGELIPPGARVYTQEEPKRQYPVAYQGETFIDDAKANHTYIASWSDQQCTFVLPESEKEDPIENLGVINCTPIS